MIHILINHPYVDKLKFNKQYILIDIIKSLV